MTKRNILERKKTRVHTQHRTHSLQYNNSSTLSTKLVVFASKCWWCEEEGDSKQERILSAGPTVYSTRNPPPPQYTWTDRLCIQKMEVWRKRKRRGRRNKIKIFGPPFFFIGGLPLAQIFFKFFLPPFFIGPPPIPPPPVSAPPTPCTEYFFLPPFFYRGPPLYPPPRRRPHTPCTEFNFFYPHFFIGSPPLYPP